MTTFNQRKKKFKFSFLFLNLVYESFELNLVVMQQRAPLFKGKRNDFVRLLADFIKKENFKEVICLTSSHAYERLDSQIGG